MKTLYKLLTEEIERRGLGDPGELAKLKFGDFNTDGDILMAQRQPLPMTVCAIIPRVFQEEGL